MRFKLSNIEIVGSFAKMKNVQAAHSLDISPSKMAGSSILDQCAVQWSDPVPLFYFKTILHERSLQHFKAAEEAIFVYIGVIHIPRGQFFGSFWPPFPLRGHFY